MTSADILASLDKIGAASQAAAALGAPAQWSFAVEGVGTVQGVLARKDEAVQARFVVVERASAKRPSKSPPSVARGSKRPPAPHAAHPHATPSTTRASARPGRRSSTKIPAVPRAPIVPVVAVPDNTPADELIIEPTRHVVHAGPGHVAHIPAAPAADRAAALMLDRDADASLFTKGPKVGYVTNGRVPLRGYDLDALLEGARAAQATDLHVVAGRPPLFRLAGELAPEGEVLDEATVEKMLLAIVPARLRAGFDQEGSCDFALAHPKHGRARINIVKQRTGLKGCFRLIPAEVPSLETLGLPRDIEKATHHHQGLIVVTGPTGHGKTTTLAAIVDIINTTTSHHVITVEDPIEYVHGRKRATMSQREVGTHTKSFRAALKGSLREDPDVIVVGELRDLETMQMALAAGETGHLVIGTMNTPSAAKTIDRIIDMFPPGDQQQVRTTLAGALKLVVGQRLVPAADRSRMHAAVELLTGTVALWNLIRDEKTFQIPSLQQRGKALGIVRLDDSLADLVRAGKVDREAALAVAESPDTLLSLLGVARAPVAAGAAPAAPPPSAAQQPAQKPGGGFLDRFRKG
ncbi:MAG: PilT/PilU family type 4a pilus ATPase [Myxococcales bacterium]|nr:PilT/PilU family type 4a pilus ATPase [Myxococcales bacterium]